MSDTEAPSLGTSKDVTNRAFFAGFRISRFPVSEAAVWRIPNLRLPVFESSVSWFPIFPFRFPIQPSWSLIQPIWFPIQVWFPILQTWFLNQVWFPIQPFWFQVFFIYHSPLACPSAQTSV